MADGWSAIGVFALGGIGWLVASFVGQPFRRFFDLRNEVIHKGVLYANVRAAQQARADGTVEPVDLGEGDLTRLREAEEAFRDLAARMRAFALNEPLAVWLVSLWQFNPMVASTALLSVSNTLNSYGGERAAAKSKLENTLGFRIETVGSHGGGKMAKKMTGVRALCAGLGLVAIGVGGLTVAWIDREAAQVVGATLLGFIIGMLVGFFAQEAKEWTRSAMTASIAVLTGAGALTLLRYGAPDPHGVWFYPVGLVIGFGVGTIWDAIDPP